LTKKPLKKEIFFISKTRVEELGEIITKIKKKNDLGQICFWSLGDLVGYSNYFYYLRVLFNDLKINSDKFCVYVIFFFQILNST